MKKIREFLGSGDRLRLILSIAAVSAALLTALLLPLAFRAAPAPEAPAAEALREKKTLLFARYWNSDDDPDLTIEKIEPPAADTAKLCRQAMASAVARCIDDKAAVYAEPTGSEYTVVTDEDGTRLELCRMWLELRGDWQNWLDICFDANTGEPYYLYLSRECLANRSDYNIPRPTPQSVAQELAEAFGWTLRHLDSDADGATAVFSTDGGTVCYHISGTMYDALVDVQIRCA